MTSLRVALKLSMAEVKPDEKRRKNPLLTEKVVEEPSLDDVLSGRKRKSSFEVKEGKSRPYGREKPARSSNGPRSSSPADESLTGRSEGSGYVMENSSVASEDPRRSYYHEDHESIASMRADDISVNEDGQTDRPGSSNSVLMDEEHPIGDEPVLAATASISAELTTKTKQDDIENDGEDKGNDEDNDGEEGGGNRASKKQKKRVSSILKSLEPIHPDDPPAAQNQNEEDSNLPRYQSNRAAAMVAKTKLSAKVGGRSGSLGEDSVPAAPEAAAAETATAQPSTKNSNIKSRRKSGALASAPKLNWVQCNKCTKWRTVAAHVNERELPDEWYCHMNSWDANFSTCEAAEEAEQPTAPASRARSQTGLDEAGGDADGKNQQRVWVKAGNGGRGRWRRPGEGEGRDRDRDSLGGGEGNGNDGYTAEDGGDNNEVQPAEKEEPPTVGVQIPTRRRASQGTGRQAEPAATGTSPRGGIAQRQSSGGNAAAASTAVAVAVPPVVDVPAVNWVQCNKCKKWRKVPETIDVDALPEKWFCSLNTWAPAMARCSAKQEPDDPVVPVAPVETAAAPGVKGMNRARRQQSGGAANGSSNALPNLASPIAPPGTIKKVQWVQCERRNCKKWRKVPGAIDMELFPEKWYCEMNTWDGDSATCDAPEASDSENEQPGGAASRQQLILANSKGANALSYRRIIFGTDGRTRVCFSDKNKNGYGIFSYSEAHKPSNDADDYTAPTRRVGYWWSGAYDESAGAAAAQTSAPGGKVSNKKLAAAAAAAAIMAENGEAPGSTTTVVAKAEAPAPTYLLDTARRLSGMVPRPAAFSWPKKVSKSWTLLAKIPLFRRQALECTVVMSCFMTTSSSQLPFSKLLGLLSTCRFADAEVDACREYLGPEGLKGVVKRLEDKGLVEVSYSSTGQLNVDVLTPVAQVAQNCAVRGAQSVAAATGVSAAWTKQGLPLKMRKFHAEGKYKQDTLNEVNAATAKAAKLNAANRTVKVESDQQKVLESLASVSVSASSAHPMKPFRLQHREKWTASVTTQS